MSYGGTLAAIGGTASGTTKSTHEAIGIPTPQANAEGLRMTRMAIYMARQIRLDGLAEFEREKDLIRREVRAVVDRVLEMGDGDAFVGTLRGFESRVATTLPARKPMTKPPRRLTRALRDAACRRER